MWSIVRFEATETNDFRGSFTWFKSVVSKAKHYANGFKAAHLLEGSRYIAPVGTTNRILGITDGAVILSGGNRPVSITNAVTLGLNSKITNASPNKLTLTFTPTSALFSGTFIEVGTSKKVLFKEAVLLSLNTGSGFFLGTNQSGRVTFQPTL